MPLASSRILHGSRARRRAARGAGAAAWLFVTVAALGGGRTAVAQSQVPRAAQAAPAAGATTPVLTFDGALALALERSPGIVTAQGGREVAAAQLRRARAWENPRLEIEAENVLGQGAYADFDAAETTVSLTQALPFGGGRAALVRGARAGDSQAAVESELARIAVRRDLALAYAEAVAADRLAALERERARLGAQTRAAVEKRFAAGLESDLQRARVEVETSGLEAAARRAAAEAQARRRALGAQWRAETVVEPLDQAWFDATGTDPGPTGAPTAAPDSPPVAGAAATVHPRLRSAELGVARARAGLEAARAQRFAGLEASVGTRRFADQPGDSDQAFVIGLSMPLPLWDRNGAGIAEARAALSAAELEAERIRLGLPGERAAAVAQRDAAKLEVTALAERGEPAAASAAQLAMQGYDAGRLSLLDRLDAERALSDVRERLVRARLDLQRASAEFESLR